MRRNGRTLEPALLECLSGLESITDEAAIAAYKFLTDDWLVDPGYGVESANWRTENERAIELREALQSLHDGPRFRDDRPLPNQSVGKILKKAADRPVLLGKRTVRLRVVKEDHNARTYKLEVIKCPQP